MHKFKREDNVKVKEGTQFPDSDIVIDNWQGRVFEVDPNGTLIELDSITLQNIPKKIIQLYKDAESYPYLIFLPFSDLEPCEPRDDYEEVSTAQDKIAEEFDKYFKTSADDKIVNKWNRHFQRSHYYQSMPETTRMNVDEIIGSFAEHMLRYEGCRPRQWNTGDAKEVLLYWMPTKYSAKQKTFEDIGVVLSQFFTFLAEKKYLKTAKQLQELVLEVKDEVIANSQDRSNWGPAKSFVMGAAEAGVDMSNEEEIDRFLLQKQMEGLTDGSGNDKFFDDFEEVEDTKKMPNLGRNQIVTVKYYDGTVKVAVKFKKVKDDLKAGKCELLDY